MQDNKTRRFIPAAKRKQWIRLTALLLVIAVLALSTAYFLEKRKKTQAAIQQPPKKEAMVPISQADEFINGQARWQSNEGARIENTEKKLQELSRQLEEEKQRNNNIKIGDDEVNLPLAPPRGMPPDLKMPSGEPKEIARKPTIVTIILDPRKVDNQSPYQREGVIQKDNEVALVHGIKPNIKVIKEGGEVSVVNNRSEHQVSYAKIRARESYIPSGTFFRAILLGGLDAPTGGDAQNASPHPVLMRVVDLAQMPNRFKQDFKDCFITGTGYGDISAERAYMRPDKLSCVYRDGGIIDVNIKGYVAGEDGKAGVRGRLIEKQGQILANALFTGLISGFGQGVANSYKSTTTGPFGTTSGTSAGQEYKAGIAEGVGGAMDRLAQYYIKLADKVFPVIEIDAGRQVDVVLLNGIQLGEQK